MTSKPRPDRIRTDNSCSQLSKNLPALDAGTVVCWDYSPAIIAADSPANNPAGNTLALAALVIRPDGDREAGPTLSSHSAAPDGSLALVLWLQTLDYQVDRMQYRSFQPDDQTSVLFVLAPTQSATETELRDLRAWVERGGTLIIAGTRELPGFGKDGKPLLPADRALASILGKFDLDLRPLNSSATNARPTQPLLLRPIVRDVRVETRNYISGTNTLSYLGEQDKPVAVGLTFGNGKVYVLASTYAFSNQGLAANDNAALLLNWLPSAPRSRIAVDEIHHGLVEARSFSEVVLREPWGWAILYVVGIVFIYLVVAGRRFGTAIVPPLEGRRPASDYVASVADLLRRGDKQDWVLAHYRRALRRQLAASYGWDADLPSEAVASRLKGLGCFALDVDGEDIARLLDQLDAGKGRPIAERRMVELAVETDRIIMACQGRAR